MAEGATVQAAGGGQNRRGCNVRQPHAAWLERLIGVVRDERDLPDGPAIDAVRQVCAGDQATPGIAARLAVEMPPRICRDAVPIRPGHRGLQAAATGLADHRPGRAGTHKPLTWRGSDGWVVAIETHWALPG